MASLTWLIRGVRGIRGINEVAGLPQSFKRQGKNCKTSWPSLISCNLPSRDNYLYSSNMQNTHTPSKKPQLPCLIMTLS